MFRGKLQTHSWEPCSSVVLFLLPFLASVEYFISGVLVALCILTSLNK